MRSSAVFEDVGTYPLPTAARIPAWDETESLVRNDVIPAGAVAQRLVKLALRLSGFRAAHKAMSANIETLLRHANTRVGKLFGPVYSASVVLRDEANKSPWASRAARLVVACHQICREVMAGTFAPDEVAGAPAEMGQYPNLFSTSLWAAQGRPFLHKGTQFNQLGVILGGRAYTVDLGTDPSVGALEATLATLGHTHVPDADTPLLVGAANGRTLVRAFEDLEKSEDALTLRDCFMMLCLDLDHEPEDAFALARLAQAANPTNRWYPASFQLVVTKNAKAAAIFAFPAYLDGNVMMRAGAEANRRAVCLPSPQPSEMLPIRQLRLTPAKRLVERARRQVISIQDPQRASFELRDIGRKRFEELQLDAVPTFVAALAIATTKTYGRLPNLGQLLSVSKYRALPVGGAVVSTSQLRALVTHVLMNEAGADASLGLMLHDAIKSQQQACRAARGEVPLVWMLQVFLQQITGCAKLRAATALGCAIVVLRLLGAPRQREIVMSHPQIFEEVELLARAGVRLPYLDLYGLHYQIFDDRIVLTFAAGRRGRPKHTVLVAELERALQLLTTAARRPATANRISA